MTLSAVTIATFVVSIALQVFALSLLPTTAGFTKWLPTLILAVSFLSGIGLLARLSADGAPLGILVPFASAAVPLTVLAVAIFINHEPASLLKIAMLVGACILIGAAGLVS